MNLVNTYYFTTKVGCFRLTFLLVIIMLGMDDI